MVEDLNLAGLEEAFVEEVGLHRTSKTIQVLLLRQTHDYSIFRTEETRELNVVTLPRSAEDPTSMIRVAMLASKQKAPENRHYLRLVRTLMNDDLNEDQKKCALKDDLCQQCPRCVLFGAVSTATGRTGRFNIKHRVSYSTAYSIEAYDQVSEMVTFNAVDSVNQSTGQALGYTENVSPVVNFPSIVTLNSVTREEFIMYLKTVLSCRSYGAETRVKGDMVNHIVGISGGLEEIVTPLDLLLAASSDSDRYLQDPAEETYHILQDFSKHAVFKDQLSVLTPDQLASLVSDVSDLETGFDFASDLYRQAEGFYEKLKEYKPGG
jgi:CRISPR-associated protein Csc2